MLLLPFCILLLCCKVPKPDMIVPCSATRDVSEIYAEWLNSGGSTKNCWDGQNMASAAAWKCSKLARHAFCFHNIASSHYHPRLSRLKLWHHWFIAPTFTKFECRWNTDLRKNGPILPHHYTQKTTSSVKESRFADVKNTVSCFIKLDSRPSICQCITT
jgi:hypothetical protein